PLAVPVLVEVVVGSEAIAAVLVVAVRTHHPQFDVRADVDAETALEGDGLVVAVIASDEGRAAPALRVLDAADDVRDIAVDDVVGDETDGARGEQYRPTKISAVVALLERDDRREAVASVEGVA